MLDDVTKKRINTLRQILVGKLPDPKAQVEQITNGLIYKFMNDMDEQSVSMGGKSTYFSGKFQRYSWKNLMDTKTSGVEKIKLYSDAIEQMYTNENLPELFREIFKNSFLPFKDPSTLNMFLKEINEFHYSNSEKLGDAFEYLLSFMGSQGDAGQFRTPRHIIDLIVEIVNPQKNETILDPACGTAGFLISSYKHILNQNTKKNLGDGLNASDRKKIGENLNGYDISPDMVKMSLVNMYLHKFTNPKINEYDTLSSEDRWNEYYDVILANPPFFSPKGGITPHNRFGVNSSKAEVLFVDYINEHLKPKGRAGIIVPEGIIIQNGNAYKQLRKNLIENSLIGVISLPVGVFQPYSNVKTSVLILDKNLSKQSDKIYFFEVKNDGFELSSQRRKIENSDLPEIVEIFKNNIIKNQNINFVTKEDILLSKNISISFNNYLKEEIKSTFQIVKLGDVCDFQGGSQPPKENFIYEENDGYIRFLQIRDFGNSEKFKTFIPMSNKNKLCNEDDILIGRYGASVGSICSGLKGAYNVALIKCIYDKNKIINKYLYYYLKSKIIQDKIISLSARAAQAGVNPKHLKDFDLPLPSIDKQKELVDEIQTYQNVIDGCFQVINNYKTSIDFNPKYKKVRLGDICDFSGGTQPPKSTFIDEYKEGYVRLLQIRDYKNDKFKTYIPKSEKHKLCNDQDIMIGRYGPPVFQILKGKSGAYNVALMKCIPNNNVLINDWLYYFLKSAPVQNKIISLSQRARQSGVRPEDLNELLIPLPSIEKQNFHCEELNKEIKIVNDNNELIIKMQHRITEKLNSLWSN